MRETVLYTLAQAALGGEAELATAPASAADPMLRPFVKAQVRSAIRAAREAAKGQGDEHVLKLAFLLKLGPLAPGLAADDARGVAAAFAAEAKPYEAPRKPSRVLTLLVLAGAVAAIGAVLFFKLRPAADARFVESPLGVALAEPLTELSLADETKKKEKARAEVLSDDVKSQLGDETFALLQTAIDAPDVYLQSKSEYEAASADLAKSVDDLDDALEKAQIPAFLAVEPREGSIGQRRATLHAFVVRERADVSVRGANVKVVWGYRLDNLGSGWFTVMRTPGSSWVRVNLDMVSEVWSDLLVPVLARDKPSRIGGKSSHEDTRALEKTIRTAMRDDLRTCVGIDDPTFARLADAIEQRDSRFEILKDKFKFYRGTFSVVLTPATRKGIQKIGEDAMIDQALDWDSRLRTELDALTKAIEPFALVAEERGVYAELTKEKFLAEHEALAGDGVVAGTLAVLSHPRRCYRFDLAHVVLEMLGDFREWRRTHPAVTVLGGLLGELGLGAAADWFPEKGLDEPALMVALDKLMQKPEGDVQAAAKRAYRTYFGADPAAYERKPR